MSNSGRYTSLSLNVYSSLLNNSGFVISPVARAYQGTWINGSYTAGTVTTSTVLNKITGALPNFLVNCVPAKLSVANWRNLLRIGSTTCPALGNSRPSTFIPTYAGYGTWENKSVDAYGNITGTGSQSMTAEIYPPKNYGKEKTYSYIYQNKGKYAWVTGWPGRNSWQKPTDDFSAAYEPGPSDTGLIDYDTYFSKGFIATVAQQAYYEFWYNYATRRNNQYLEFVKMMQQCINYSTVANSDIASLVNTQTFIKGNYSNINDLTTSDISGVNLAFKDFGNDMINLGKSVDLRWIDVFGLPSKLLLTLQENGALTEAVKFAILYAGLSTVDFNNVLISTYVPDVDQEKKIYEGFLLVSGQDLETVKIILNCATVGLDTLADLINPQKMFPNSYYSLTVPEYSVSTLSNKLYKLIYAGNNVNTNIQNWGQYLIGIMPADLTLACGAFMMSMNQIKNIKNMNFEKIAQVVSNLEMTNMDLPLVNSTSATPGNVDLAKQGLLTSAFGSGNSGVFRFCDFFGAMSGWPYRDLYQQVQNLLSELPVSGLNAIYTKLYQKSLGNDWALLSSGTGSIATTLYRVTSDAFTGAPSIKVTSDITQVLTVGDTIAISVNDSLSTPVAHQYIITSLNSNTIGILPSLMAPAPAGSYIFKPEAEYDTSVSNLITAANAQISNIAVSNSQKISQLNTYWNRIGTQLAIEQRAIPLAVQLASNVYNDTSSAEITAFVKSIPQYALNTFYCETAPILEAIADTTTVGGQSLVAMMREARNAQRIMNAGGDLDNDIPDQLPANTASASANVVDGKIDSITLTSPGSGYGIGCDCCAPAVIIYPQGGVFGGSGTGATAVAIMDENTGSVAEIVVTDPGIGYSDANPPEIVIDSPPEPDRMGEAIVPGSFAGSPYTGQDPVSNNLVIGGGGSFKSLDAMQIHSH